MQKISGTEIAETILRRLEKERAPEKIFAAILVGDDPCSKSFLKIKRRVADRLGVRFEQYTFSDTLTTDELREEVRSIALSKQVGGVIVQLPLPSGMDEQLILNTIPWDKDVDVLGECALGSFYTGSNAIAPPSVSVLGHIIDHLDFSLIGKKIAVVGLGRLIGRPIMTWLSTRASTIYLLDKGADYSVLKDADLVITGTGQSGLIRSSMVKPGAIVLDFGYGEMIVNGKKRLCGDLDPTDAEGIIHTPTPGGTGPLLVGCLFENFYLLHS
jgi:methylenetetrahydrofolate dehydrogenase (NADP+)/methenyltetrahydrofolate cyclohydrolase